jgi:hypothetical protein
LAAVAVLASGCGNNPPKGKYVPVDASAAQLLQGSHVQLLVKPTPGFRHFTSGDQAAMTVGMLFGAIGGGIGAAAAIKHSENAGQALVAENGISDPAPLLSEKVRDMLTTKYGSVIGDSSRTVTVAVDFWSLTKGNVVFGASVVVAEAQAGTSRKTPPLASGECRYRSASGDGAPSEDDLLANHAEKLKAELASALDHCVGEFGQKLFL